MIKINYDKSVDAAYIFFGEFPASTVDKTYLCNLDEVEGMINLDFFEGKLVGIEIMDASKKLPSNLLVK